MTPLNKKLSEQNHKDKICTGKISKSLKIADQPNPCPKADPFMSGVLMCVGSHLKSTKSVSVPLYNIDI